MGRKSRQNLQEINWNVLVRASQTFAWMQELRAKGHLTGYFVKDIKERQGNTGIFIMNNI